MKSGTNKTYTTETWVILNSIQLLELTEIYKKRQTSDDTTLQSIKYVYA